MVSQRMSQIGTLWRSRSEQKELRVGDFDYPLRSRGVTHRPMDAVGISRRMEVAIKASSNLAREQTL